MTNKFEQLCITITNEEYSYLISKSVNKNHEDHLSCLISFRFRKFRSQRPKQILINLCFALLGLYLSFLIGIDRVNLKIGCTIFGALIHFFCLASVAWMCVEAVNMYLLFVKIFDSGVSRFMLKSMAAAWGKTFEYLL